MIFVRDGHQFEAFPQQCLHHGRQLIGTCTRWQLGDDIKSLGIEPSRSGERIVLHFVRCLDQLLQRIISLI